VTDTSIEAETSHTQDRDDYPTLSAVGNREIARAVYGHARLLPEARHLRLMPRERGARSTRQADFSEWWLSPDPRWPGYRHSKLFMDRVWGPPGRRLPGLLRAGFTVARGFGRQAEALVPPALVIDSGWCWYRFLSDSLAGAFDAPVRAVLAAAGQPVLVDLSLYYFDRLPTEATEAARPVPDDRVSFAIHDDSLAFVCTNPGGDSLAPLASVGSLRELAIRVEGTPDLTWYWIDVRICVKAWYIGPESGGNTLWRPPDLWQRALAPWLRWVH